MRAISRIQIRKLSTPALSPQEIASSVDRTEKFTKFIQQSAYPSASGRIVGNGKELHVPENISEIAALSGMPAEHAARTVTIAQRIIKTSQNSTKYSHQWQITWKPQEGWKNPLMGWTSSADPMSSVKLTFDSDQHAIDFANKNGWKYDLVEEAHKETADLATSWKYKDNFLPPRVVLELERDGTKTKIFASPGFGKSNFFMPLKYNGIGEVDQHGPRAAVAN